MPKSVKVKTKFIHSSTFYRSKRKYQSEFESSNGMPTVFSSDSVGDHFIGNELMSNTKSMPNNEPIIQLMPHGEFEPFNNNLIVSEDNVITTRIQESENLNQQYSNQNPKVFFPDNNDDEEEEDVIENELQFADGLKIWAIENKISHLALNQLLKHLKASKINGFENLPTDSRTLLSTPRSVNIEDMGSGLFWYGGIKECLMTAFLNCDPPSDLRLNFNMDGLPTNNSSNMEFWPILMRVSNSNLNIPTMVVAIYSGIGKPPSCEQYLRSFVTELLELISSELIINNKATKVSVNSFICDTPARAYIKCK